MLGVSLDSADQLRNKVITLLQLNINVGKSILAVVAELYQIVVNRNDPNDKEDHYNKDNNSCTHDNVVF